MIRCIALIPLIAASAVAQVTLTATAAGAGFGVDVNGTTQSIASGVDVSAGASLTIQDPTIPSMRADVALSITRDPREFSTVLTVSSATAPAGFFNAFANAEAHLSYASSIPIDVVVEVTIPRFLATMITCSAESNRVTIVSGPSWQSQFHCPLLFPDFEPCSFRYPTTIDANGLSVEIEGVVNSVTNPFGICPSGGSGQTSVAVRVVPSAPATSFGVPCGVELATFGNLLDPTRGAIEVEAPAASILGVLLFGSTQQALPLPGGCTLHVDLLFDVSFAPDPSGRFAIEFPLPPAGLLTMQAATSDGMTIVLSGGQQF